MALKPLGDRVIVERIEEDVQKTPGGIIIPDTAKEKPQRGKVIAVGEGRRDDNGKRIPLDLAEGDTVIFGKYSGSEIKVDGKEYLIMHESDVMAKLA
ncbi:MAG: co-chaperone GroES [Candidatus Sumerlaeia bacterium]